LKKTCDATICFSNRKRTKYSSVFLEVLSCWQQMHLACTAASLIETPMLARVAKRPRRTLVSLLFVTVHPPTAHGRHPYDSCVTVPRSDENILIDTLLRLFMHCSPVHNVLLDKFDASGSVYIGKMLGFVKKLVCKSVRMSSARSFRDVGQAQQGTMTEMTRLHVQNRRAHCQTVAHFLCAMSPNQIVSYKVPYETLVENVVIDHKLDVVWMYRISNRVCTNVLPVQLGEYKLVAAFGNKTLSQFYFRWHFNFKFWNVCRVDKHDQSATMTEAGGLHNSGLLFPLWQLFVYSNASKIESINNALLKSLGGQEKMYCNTHHLYLVKKSILCTAMCCVKHCTRNARWLCLARGLPCSHGICFCHGRDILRRNVVVNIEQDIAGRLLKSGARVSTAQPGVPGSSEEDSASSGCDSDGEISAPIGQEYVGDGTELPSLHSRKDMIPIYDVNRTIPGHFLWNKGYGVLRRRLHLHPSVEANAMMQHIVSVTGSPSVSLMYPERHLFPRTFRISRESAVVGAIPSFMLNCYSDSADHGVASLKEHHAIRMRDGDILTSKQNSYWHYVFDLALNQQLIRYSSK